LRRAKRLENSRAEEETATMANSLTVLVPISLILFGYRYGYLSFELSFILAGLLLAAALASH